MGEIAPVGPVAIVPAAGRSRRMGRPKLLLPYRQTTVLGATVAALARGGATPLVVRAPRDRALAAWAAELGVQCAVNPDPERGMLSSVQAGIAAAAPILGARPSAQTVAHPLLVCPGDLPRLRAASVESLLAAQRRSGALLVVPTWRDRRGHPLVIAPPLIAEIATLDPEEGLRQLLTRHAGELLCLPLDDPGVVHDIDTPADYASLRQPTQEPSP